MSLQPLNFTTPVGRLVGGDLYTASDKDGAGNLRVYKSGPQTGQPRPEFYIAVAIPKERDPATGQIKHWAATEWGAKIWQAGHMFQGNASQNPKFAWKIKDGDSDQPDLKGRKPRDREGYPGNWILSMSSGYAPRLYTLIGQPPQSPAPFEQKDAIHLGCYVQVNANVVGNESLQQPGVYLNLSMVCLCGYGERIVVGPDVSQAGFGGAPLPPGASTVPQGGFTPPASAGGAVGGVPGVPGAPMMQTPAIPGAAPYSTAPTTPAAPTTVQPNPAFLAPGGSVPAAPGAPMPPGMAIPAVPGVPGAPGAPMAPAAAAPMIPPHLQGTPGTMRTMTAAAGGVPYSDYIAKQWNDQLLIQHGLMTP